jgi:hypothetical protein
MCAPKSRNAPPPHTHSLPCNGRKRSGAGQKLVVFGMFGCTGLLWHTMWMQQQVWLVELVIVCELEGVELDKAPAYSADPNSSSTWAGVH